MKPFDQFSLIFAVLFSCASAAAFAGPLVSETTDKRIPCTTPETTCFGAGFDVGFFSTGLSPRHESGIFKDCPGGGALVEYLINEPIVLQASHAALATGDATHFIHADFVLCAPVQSICLAPQLVPEGGVNMHGSNQEKFHVGAGPSDINRLGNGTRNWYGESDLGRDFIIVRFGLKLRL